MRKPFDSARTQAGPGRELDDRRPSPRYPRHNVERRSLGRAKRGEGGDRHDDRGDREDAQRQDQPVGVHTHVGIRPAGDADGKQWRRGHGTEHGEERTSARDEQHLRSAHRDALGAGDAEGAERRLIDTHQRDLAGQHDPDRDDTREGGHSGEDPQRKREHVDRVLGASTLDGGGRARR